MPLFYVKPTFMIYYPSACNSFLSYTNVVYLYRSQFLNIFSTYTKMTTFKLSDYDVVGFDLDNTLLEYDHSKLFPMQYEFLAKYLVERKGYRGDVFSPRLSSADADFIQRGLFLDLRRGNVLHLRRDGYIIKASHGTNPLREEQVAQIYGENKKWSLSKELMIDLLSLWNMNEAKSFLDFTDSVGTLIFAKAVDSVDHDKNTTDYTVWPDVLEAIVEMYKLDSSYIQTFLSNILELAKPCDNTVISWLWTLKKNSKVFLITGAEPEIAKVTIPLCLGKDYSQLIDLVVIQAKKPGFFTNERPFLTLDGTETSLCLNSHNGRATFRQGNWSAIHRALEKEFGRNPKCVYFGDNPLQDIYAPTRISSNLDTVALIEEVASDGLHPEYLDYPHAQFVSSMFWGSFLGCPGSSTLIGAGIKESAKLIVPSVKVVASKPIDYGHIC